MKYKRKVDKAETEDDKDDKVKAGDKISERESSDPMKDADSDVSDTEGKILSELCIICTSGYNNVSISV